MEDYQLGRNRKKTQMNVRREGMLIKNGFNFYPLSDNNFGFLYMTRCGSKVFQVRYCKPIKKWFFGNFYEQKYKK